MFTRFLNIDNELDTSIFLFGARQTGKSTFLRQQLPNAIYYDLLNSELKRRFTTRPELLYELLHDKPDNTICVIDEIQEVPQLLNEVHRLIQSTTIRFVLCGSSARKLKRKGYNTLGGRAIPCYMYPLVSAEIPDFDVQKALLYGLLPPHYLSTHPQRLLSAYIDVYLRQEIQSEAFVRNLTNFQRFLDVAALSNSEIVNYTNIATDCGVSAKTVKAYFEILTDTLIGYLIPPFTRVTQRKVVQMPKFYFFDVGVYNYLCHRTVLTPHSKEYGHCFEHLVIQELIAYIGYTHNTNTLSYWHTYSGYEMDVVIGDALLGIEIKSVEEVQPKHLRNFRPFQQEFTNCRCLMVSQDKLNRTINGIECIYVIDFLQHLWHRDYF